jgi:hypothetical protein
MIIKVNHHLNSSALSRTYYQLPNLLDLKETIYGRIVAAMAKWSEARL